MYASTGIFLVSFTVFIQISVNHGLGQNFWTLSISDSSDAIFWTYVANTFAITGNAMAKLSMGLFLLRVVQVRWHKIALWTLVFVTVTTSSVLTIMLWNQTTPIKASWDPLRTPGRWHFQIKPLSVGLGVWSSACDFFFAIFPWLFIWSLRMPQREKIMLAGGMSLGVIAGACGITRTIVLAQLDVYNYTLNFNTYFAWAGAEIAVAMICVGIPTLRPLYLKTRGITSTHDRSNTSELPRFTMLKDNQPSVNSSMRHDSMKTSPSTMESGRQGETWREKSALARPENVYTRSPKEEMARSPREDTYTRSPRQGSVASRPSAEMVGPGNRGGVIWVKSEVKIREEEAEWPLSSNRI